MSIYFSLLFILLSFSVNFCVSVDISFTRNGINVSRAFESDMVSFKLARRILNLRNDEIFVSKDDGIIDIKKEKMMLLSPEECYAIIGQNAESTLKVCIDNDQCKKIVLKNNAKVNTLRDVLLSSLPNHYRNEKCADIVFKNEKGQAIQRSEEINLPYQNILKNGRIEAYNKFMDNTTNLDITWLLYSHRVKVNMLMKLSSLRYWITSPNACPNLKVKLNLPDNTLFPNPMNDLAENWLARDKHVLLDQVKSHNVVSTQQVAPYAHEASLSIQEYAYKTEQSNIPRLYYVDVNEKHKVAFTGSRTDEFNDDQLTLNIKSRSPKDKILLGLKDVRSTNNRAISWTNVVISTNNTAVTFTVKWNNPQPGHLYIFELFDSGANHEKHKLESFGTENGVCTFNHIRDGDSHYDLLLKNTKLIENGRDLSKFRYEVGVTVYPYRAGTWKKHDRVKRDAPSYGNTDIHQDQITMGMAGKGDNHGDLYPNSFYTLNDTIYTQENKRSLYFNVFIFKSQEIAEKIIEDIATF